MQRQVLGRCLQLRAELSVWNLNDEEVSVPFFNSENRKLCMYRLRPILEEAPAHVNVFFSIIFDMR